MSTALYLVGFLVLIAGLAWGASALGVPSLWIGIGVVVMAGIAIISIAGNVRDKEVRRPPPPSAPPRESDSGTGDSRDPSAG